MAWPIDIPTIINVIKACIDQAENVLSNKKSCHELSDDLSIVHGILSTLDPEAKARAEKHRLDRVLTKLRNITSRAKALFNKCTSTKKMVKIRNFMGATSIKQELTKLNNEVQKSISMLILVFSITNQNGAMRGASNYPKVSDEDFDEVEEDIINIEEYYQDVDDDDDESA